MTHWLRAPITPEQAESCGSAVLALTWAALEYTPDVPNPKWLAVSGTGLAQEANAAIACLDATHWGEVAPGDRKSQPPRFYATIDGGKTWNISTFPPTWNFSGFAASNGVYYLFGWKETGESGAEGVGLSSSDGITWNPWPKTPQGALYVCSGTSCDVGSGWVDLGVNPPQYWQLPKGRLELTNSSASLRNVHCVTGTQMACAIGTSVDEASLEPKANVIVKSNSKPHNVVPARCVTCAPVGGYEYPSMAKLEDCQGEVSYHGIISKTGRLKDLVLVYAPCRILADSALKALAAWRYTPTMLDGKPVEVDTVLNVIYTLGR